MDPELTKAIIGALSGAGVMGVIIAAMKRPTERDANEIARQKMLVEADELERKEAQDRFNAEKALRDELRAENKILRDELRASDAEKDRYRKERNEAREALDEWATRCRQRGYPCGVKQLPVIDEPTQPNPGSAGPLRGG